MTAQTTVGEAALTPDRIMQIGFGFWGSKALLTAVELGLFSALGDGQLGAEELQGRLGLQARGLTDFLDALVALGFLDRQDGRYANTPETALFLDRAKPAYLGGILEMANARLYPFWGSLTEALRTGAPQNEIKAGEDLFAALYGDPPQLRGFLHAMTGLSLGAAHAIAQKFAWEKYSSFADIGCAEGGVAGVIAQHHGHLHGIGFDLPPVQPVFEDYVASLGLRDRLAFQAGDFWHDPLPRVDVLILGHILHDWDLEQKLKLIAAAYDALPAGGALIAFDAVIDDERRQNAFGLLMSLNMLIETAGGFDYSGADCSGWMRQAGFRVTYTEPLVGPDSMVVGIK